MTPYIEYKGKKYEFKSNFIIEKEFNNEIKDRYIELINQKGLNEQDLEEINTITEFIKNNSNYIQDEKKLKSEEPEMFEKIKKYLPILNALNVNDIYEKYCFKLLEKEYRITYEDWCKMLEQYYEDYCDTYDDVDTMISRVIELVFTQKALEKNKKKKPMPSWIVG